MEELLQSITALITLLGGLTAAAISVRLMTESVKFVNEVLNSAEKGTKLIDWWMTRKKDKQRVVPATEKDMQEATEAARRFRDKIVSCEADLRPRVREWQYQTVSLTCSVWLSKLITVTFPWIVLGFWVSLRTYRLTIAGVSFIGGAYLCYLFIEKLRF